MKTNLKPFDLELALSGQPVMVRDGRKAFVRHHETELSTPTVEMLLGYLEGVGAWTWGADGASRLDGDKSQYDIVGMYPRTHSVNGFEVPAPETERLEFGVRYYLASPDAKDFYMGEIWNAKAMDGYWLERGLVFLTREDAIANSKAMLGIDPKEEVIK